MKVLYSANAAPLHITWPQNSEDNYSDLHTALTACSQCPKLYIAVAFLPWSHKHRFRPKTSHAAVSQASYYQTTKHYGTVHVRDCIHRFHANVINQCYNCH